MGANDFDRGEVEEGPRTQPALVEGLTAADYAAGLRALADAIEAGGLPASLEFPYANLGMTLYVSSAAAVRDFAARHDLPVRERGTHTTVDIVLGPHPKPTYGGSAQLSVIHIDPADEQEQAEKAEVVEEQQLPGAEYGDAADAAGSEYREAQQRAESYDGSWYECTDCNMVTCCPSSAPDEEHEQWQQDVAEHEEQHRNEEDAQLERVDPDDPASMALPVIGDTVLLSDGTTARVLNRYDAREAPQIANKWQVTGPFGARVVGLDQIVGYPEDDGTSEAEALAEVIVPGLRLPAEVRKAIVDALGSAASKIRESRIERPPSLVQLDAQDAAVRLADAVTDLLVLIGSMTFGPDDNVAPVREALADFRAAVTR